VKIGAEFDKETRTVRQIIINGNHMRHIRRHLRRRASRQGPVTENARSGEQIALIDIHVNKHPYETNIIDLVAFVLTCIPQRLVT
jgi:hypothetical protein